MHWWKPAARRAALIWHRIALSVIGVRVNVVGRPPAERPLLIVANHLSWSDILILGSVMELCFVAKSDVRKLPVINALAFMQRTVFVDRARRQHSGLQADSIAARLLENDAMVLFAEGTTGNGHRILPFKSALFGSVHMALRVSNTPYVTVQPVALAYTRLHGLPLGRLHQSRAAWPGDMPLRPHLLDFLRAGAYDVEVIFCEPRRFSAETHRKQIAQETHRPIRRAFSHAMRMRDPHQQPGRNP